MDLAVRHDSLVDELILVQHVRNPHRRHLPPLHLIDLYVFLNGLDCWNCASVPPRALDMPMNCSSGISNLGNFFLLAHMVDFSPGWSDSLSLHFHLDDLDLHCIFDLLVHLGECFLILKILGCFTSTGFTVGWTRVLATCSGSPTADSRYRVSSTCCVTRSTHIRSI